MDEYSKTGPKRYQSEAKDRVREMERQMRALAEIQDEETLREILNTEFGVTERHPRFRIIVQTWREQRQRRP